ncbi:Pumilio like 3 [Dendrobium catenatum]|uniref:Pumilio like 3 n=1 Tax=Dendrobium catenatum TaxID=906689 RepID=A0A2I0VAW8_9ASPA|nr:Pumilio like 3 [Dendrobium catenatum]
MVFGCNFLDDCASPFLEEFKTNMTKCYELSDIIGHVVEFKADHYRSRFMQQKLEIASAKETDMGFDEIMPNALSLLTDLYRNMSLLAVFGNGLMGKTTSLHQVYEDEMIKEWVCVFSNFEEERNNTKWENVLASLSCGIWKGDWICAENSCSPTNGQTEMLVHFKDSKVGLPQLDWGKPLHVVILKSSFQVFDPGIVFHLTSLLSNEPRTESSFFLRKGRMMRSTLA